MKAPAAVVVTTAMVEHEPWAAEGLVMPGMANLRSAPPVKVPAVIVKVSTPPTMVLVPAPPAPPVTKVRVPGETTASPAALH